MARASVPTHLPIDTFGRIIGLHPLHINQVRLENNIHCSEVIFQHSWQTADHVSREEMAQAIAEAESRLEAVLGFRLCPTWEVDEWRETIRPYRKEHVNYSSSDVRGYHQTVQGNWGYMISGGREAKSLIEAGVSIAYSDPDNDGYDELATVTVNTSVLDKNEIGLFYPGEEGDDSWEIRPTKVSISSGIATITFRRELAVVPEKLELFDIEGAEAIGTDDDDFLGEVDVYRRYNDPQTQASFLWEPGVGGYCGACEGAGCAACSYATQTGCLLVRGDPRQSILGYHPASWDPDENDFTTVAWTMNRQPDIVRLYYYAGWRNKKQAYISRLDPMWERVITHYAAALLDRPPCSCVKGSWDYWRDDMAKSLDSEGNSLFRRSDDVLDNPFGTRRGEISAWQVVRPMIIGRAVHV